MITKVKAIDDPNNNPPGLHTQSIVVYTTGREIQITAETKDRHDLWMSVSLNAKALSPSLNRLAGPPVPPLRLCASSRDRHAQTFLDSSSHVLALTGCRRTRQAVYTDAAEITHEHAVHPLCNEYDAQGLPSAPICSRCKDRLGNGQESWHSRTRIHAPTRGSRYDPWWASIQGPVQGCTV